jgi:hypothetical protein
VQSAQPTNEPTVTFVTGKVAVPVKVELALEPKRRATGLMKRQSLSRDHGMLYVFPRTEDHPFWTKYTTIPLDLIFVGPSGTVVGVVAGAEPDDPTHLRVGAPSSLVLEIAAGFAAEHGIVVGTPVRLANVPASVEH